MRWLQKLKEQKEKEEVGNCILTTTLDSPIMVAAGKLKKLKEKLKVKKPTSQKQNEAEEARRMVVKKEMKEKIDAGKREKIEALKKIKRCGEDNAHFTPLRRSVRLTINRSFTFRNTPDDPVCVDVEGDTVMAEGNASGNKEQHNTYTGPMELGKKMPPPVKQFKTIVGKTKLKSAPFLSHGRNVITTAALTQAIHETARNLNKESKEKHSTKGKEKAS